MSFLHLRKLKKAEESVTKSAYMDHQRSLEIQLLHVTTESADHGSTKTAVHFSSARGKDKISTN